MELIIAALGVLVAGIAALALYRQSRPAQKLAERELSRRPGLEIFVNGSRARETIWVLPWKKGRRCIVDLEITVRNSGDTTLQDVLVILETTAEIYASEISRRPDSGARLLKLEQAAGDIPGGPYVRVMYTAEMVHPGVSLAFHDFLILSGSSRIRSKIPVTFADGVNATVTYSFVYGYPLKVSATARNVPAVKLETGLHTFDPTDPMVIKVLNPSSEEKEEGALDLRGYHTAHVLVVDKPEYPAKDLPREVARKFMRARLNGARRYPALHVPDVGYVRLEPSSN
jgi:hypothetical protein